MIFKAPTHTKTWPPAWGGAYSLRAASVEAKKYAFATPVAA